MKKYYWGTFFIACGVLFLLSNLDLLNMDFSLVRRFWPVLFILWGISLMFASPRVKTVISLISAILVAGVVFAMCDGMHSGIRTVSNWDWQQDADTTNVALIKEEFDSLTTEAELNFSGGAGEFILEDSTALLLEGSYYGSRSRAEVKRKNIGNKEILQLEINPLDRIIKNRTLNQRTVVKLNPKPVWDINFSVGAADTRLDFSSLKVRSLNIDAGAADLEVKLNSRLPSTKVEISAGASSITIRVPTDAYCKVTGETALSSFDTAGFTETSDNVYQTANEATAKSKIEIQIDAGVSSIEIERY